MGFFQKLTESPGPVGGYNFSERVRKVLAMAREEAVRLHHEYVGTEHILLGLLREGEGVAAAVLQHLNVDLQALRARTIAVLRPGNPPFAVGPDLPYTSRAKKVLELAMAEARELNHSYVGTEHLLLGLVREEKGIAAQVLTDTGVNLEAARAETRRLLGNEAPGKDAGAVPPRPPTFVASTRPADAAHAAAHEAQAWQRMLHALDVTARLGGTPSVSLDGDGSLTVSLGPDLVVTVSLPPDARVRRRTG